MPRAKRKCVTKGCKESFVPWNPDRLTCHKCWKEEETKRMALKTAAARQSQADHAKAILGDDVMTDTESRLRQTLNRALLKLSEARASKAELVEAVYRAALDGVQSLEIPPVPSPKPTTARGGAEVALVLLSDLQLGKRTPSYNSQVCEERVQVFAEKIKTLTDIQRQDHPVRECHVYMLGDIVEGEMIFPGQAYRIDASLYRQVMVDGPRILSGFLRHLLSHFETVKTFGIIGNHGRIGKRGDYSPETNSDRMVYRATQLVTDAEQRSGRLEWVIPFEEGERSFYAVDRIGKRGYFLFHGDQMRGGSFAGLPFYGFSRACSQWAAGVIQEPWDYAFCGHWHEAAYLPLPGYRGLWVNGSTESHNTWTQEELKQATSPKQWLLFANDYGITAEYKVHLSGPTVAAQRARIAA